MKLIDIKILNTAIERELNRAMAEFNLTYAQATVLGFLYERDGEDICQKDIEFYLGLAHPTVSSIVQRLEEKGLVVTLPRVTDRRFKRIAATQKSTALHEEIREAVDALSRKLLRGLSETQRAQFGGTVSHMIDNLAEGDL